MPTPKIVIFKSMMTTLGMMLLRAAQCTAWQEWLSLSSLQGSWQCLTPGRCEIRVCRALQSMLRGSRSLLSTRGRRWAAGSEKVCFIICAVSELALGSSGNSKDERNTFSSSLQKVG